MSARSQPPARRERRTLVLGCTGAFALAFLALAAGSAGASTGAVGGSASVWVAPSGSDDNVGTRAEPLASVSAAIERAVPGTTIELERGTYAEALSTATAGAPGAPITLRGHGAVLEGDEAESGRILQIRHDWWDVEGLEIRGLDKGVWIEGAHHVNVRSNEIHDLRGECLRIKYFASDVVVERNSIHDCGTDDFVDDPGSGKNGEGVYIGTAPEQLERNATSEPDVTTGVTVRDNEIATRGNECVDIKEAATNNVVEFNDCRDQRDPDSAGFDARGNRNVFRYNRSHDNEGAGIRLGGDTEADGTDNDVIGNELIDNRGAGIKAMRMPQGRICGNEIENAGEGDLSDDSLENPRCDEDVPKAGPRVEVGR